MESHRLGMWRAANLLDIKTNVVENRSITYRDDKCMKCMMRRTMHRNKAKMGKFIQRI